MTMVMIIIGGKKDLESGSRYLIAEVAATKATHVHDVPFIPKRMFRLTFYVVFKQKIIVMKNCLKQLK